MRELRQNWRDLFFAFRIALDPKKMMLGFVGLLVSVIILLVLAWIFSVWFPKAPTRILDVLSHPLAQANITEQDLSLPPPELAAGRGPTELQVFLRASYSALFPMVMIHSRVGITAQRTVSVPGACFVSLFLLLMLVVWSYVGGAIMRICAVEFARDDRIDTSEATEFAGRKLWSFFWGPLIPVIGVIVLMLCLIVAGWVGCIPFLGPIIVSVFAFLAWIAGFLIVFFAIGGYFGLPVMWSTVAMEGTDYFDAVSRAYSYVFSRPWRLLWYALASIVYGAVVIAFVWVFTYAMIAVPLRIAGGAMGENWQHIARFLDGWRFSPEAGWGVKIAAVIFKAWIFIIWGLFLGFIVSYKCTVWTIIYSLLRKSVDGTDMNEVYLEEEEEEFELPPAGEPEAKAEPEAEPTPAAEESPGEDEAEGEEKSED